MDQNEQNYINLMLNYNQRLKERGVSWLGPKDLGDVLLKTAKQNGLKLPSTGPGGKRHGK